MEIPKSIGKAILALGLLLVVADLSFLSVKWIGGGKPKAEVENVQNGTRTVAYYLYGNFRCVTCKSMEEMTREALSGSSTPFIVENYQAPGKERFIKDFGVVATSLLLVEEKDGKPVSWKNLERIWGLSSSKDEYIKYVRAELTSFLAGDKTAMTSGPESGHSFGAFLLALATAFGLGLMTAISPCPLTTNIAAISFLGRHASSPKRVLLSGLLYSLGRTLAYVILGAILVSGLLSAPGLSSFLSKHMNSLLGPVLLLAGLFILELLNFNMGGISFSGKLQVYAEKGGFIHSLLLGVVFALAFCPTSAALFFGGLIPLALKYSSSLWLPVSYGIATGLPVMIFAFVVALASNAVGKVFDNVVAVEKWTRLIAGAIFICVGVYYSIFTIFLA